MVLRQIDFETTVHCHFPCQMNAGLAFIFHVKWMLVWPFLASEPKVVALTIQVIWRLYLDEFTFRNLAHILFWKWQENKGLLRKGSRDRAKTICFVYLSKGYSNTTFSLCLAVQQDWIHLTDSDFCWSELIVRSIRIGLKCFVEHHRT